MRNFIVVEKTHRFGSKVQSWTEQEIKDEAEKSYDYEDNWDFDMCCTEVFRDNNSYMMFDPADYTSAEAFIDDIAEFAEHGHASVNLDDTFWDRESLRRFWETYHNF